MAVLDADQPIQILDVRDLARLVVRLVRDERPGAFHAVGPARPVTLGELIETCARVAGTAASTEIVPVQDPQAPPFFPLVRANHDGQRRSPARARAAGLTATPLDVTAADVLAWDRARGRPPLTNGYSPEREAEVLATAGQSAASHRPVRPLGFFPELEPGRD
ncbi:hypothetical protein AB0J21_11000 [Streptomyces sp. NPDC049954]|uniref:hypothetical protein n=1 Tax=Streptomyces sp. NPDC049954 TaxID=3155779 RepID=UPI003426CC0A